mgnify:CR=1 FL=1
MVLVFELRIMKIGVRFGSVFTLILLSIGAYSQSTPDMTARLSFGTSRQFSLEYRKPFKESLKWVIGADYSSEQFIDPSPNIINASDSLVTFKQYESKISRANLRFGIEKSIEKWPMWYLGANIILGYRLSKESNRIYSDTLNKNGTWYQKVEYSDPGDYSRIKRHFITTGLMLTTGLDLPLNERFVFNVNVSQFFEGAFQVADSDKLDPDDEFSNSLSTLYSDTRVGLGVRYSFK